MIYKYIVFKNTFGIAITVDAESIISPDIIDSDVLIAERIYGRVDSTVGLPQKYIEKYMYKAIKDLYSEIYQQIGGSIICFCIKDIDIVIIGFQEEALYFAMREWLSKYYNLNLDRLIPTHDVKTRKFIFDRIFE